jgi:peptide/nickel transport system ATP-binding protein
MRLLPPGESRVEGEARFEGRDLLTLDAEAMRQVRGAGIAMIFQEPMTSLNPIFTVGDQIVEAVLCHRDVGRAAARADALRLLDRVKMPNAKRRYADYPHQFSGGMRQRAMIAMALAGKPKVLIADEPTTALDVTVQGQILDLLKRLQDEESLSVLFITHDMGVVAEVADRVLVMYRGEAVETGASEDIFRGAEQPYTRMLIRAAPRLGDMRGRAQPARFPVGEPSQIEMSAAPSTAAGPLLQVRDLTARFYIRGGLFGRRTAAVHAVENVSFDLARGETLALVGESGCGKSTTGRTILRLVEPVAGSVRLDGEDVLAMSGRDLRRARRRIQMVFQDPFASLDPRMTIGAAMSEAFLDHGLGTRAEAREKAAALLQRVGLEAAMKDRYPHEFSGGQRQRVAIARTLMLDPEIIVADEAVSALDVSIKAQVCNLLLDLQQSFHLALLFISHDMAVVERMSHRVAVMRLGEIVEIGPRRAVFEDPRHPYTQRLLAASPVPDPARRRLRRPDEVVELPSALRSINYVAPARRYWEASPGHEVLEGE